nr:hypothetical protein [Stutzerimonas nitrititolerans]
MDALAQPIVAEAYAAQRQASALLAQQPVRQDADATPGSTEQQHQLGGFGCGLAARTTVRRHEEAGVDIRPLERDGIVISVSFKRSPAPAKAIFGSIFGDTTFPISDTGIVTATATGNDLMAR